MLSVSLSRKMNFLLLLKKHFLSRLHDFVSVEPIFGPCFGSDLRVRFFTDAFGSSFTCASLASGRSFSWPLFSCFTCASLASGRSFFWPLFPGSSLGVTACAPVLTFSHSACCFWGL